MSDPLAYLHHRPATATQVEVAGIGMVPAWGVIIGDRDDPDIHLFLNPETGRWMHEDLIYGDVYTTTLGDAIALLGPLQGAVAVQQTAALCAVWRGRINLGADLPLADLEDEVARGENLLGQAVRDVQGAHTGAVADLTRALAALGVDPADIAPSPPQEEDLRYLVRVVEHADVHQWWVFDDEEDEFPDRMTLHETPDRDGREGWWRTYVDDADERSMAVAQVCEEVGPRHAAGVIEETSEARERMSPALRERIDGELAAARIAAAVMITRALRAHAAQAAALQRMSERVPPPGEQRVAHGF